MTTKRPQNSILVLATLGVYLGLVLAGATPQVLAQAAMTRQFDVKDEIEVKDDLENKPDNNATASDKAANSDFAFEYSNYLLDVHQNRLEFREWLRTNCPDGCRLSKLWYFPTFSENVERFFGTSEFLTKEQWTESSWFHSIEIKNSPSKQKLATLTATFAEVSNLVSPKCSIAIKSISANTEVTLDAKNQHLVITTRLPRAGLDALLAKDAK